MRPVIVTISMLVVLVLNSHGQVRELLHDARMLSREGLFHDAAEKYKKVLQEEPQHKDANLEFAELLFFGLEDYEHAGKFIRKALGFEKDTAEVFYYAIAKCAHFHDDFDEAEKYYRIYLSKLSDRRKYDDVRKEVNIHLKSIEYARENREAPNLARLRIINLGSEINSRYSEYVPIVNEEENAIMFTSRRRNENNHFPAEEGMKFREDMYMAVRSGDKFEEPHLLPWEYRETQYIENSRKHESMVSLSPDGRILFLFKDGKLHKSEFNDTAWSTPEMLDDRILARKAYENHASVCGDGSMIFFTSDRGGGMGGLDIYVTTKKEDGEWGKPVNLGDEINTPYDEQGPFITHDGSELYFASNGHEGFGGYDIYRVRRIGDKWSAPENLGKPLNSAGDDIFYYPRHGAKEGYLSSNRKGGFGDYDLYRFYFLDKPGFDKENLVDASEYGIPDSMMTTDEENPFEELVSKENPDYVFFRVNDTLQTSDPAEVKEILSTEGGHKVEVEMVNDCDTCIYKDAIVLNTTVYVTAPAKEIVPPRPESATLLADVEPIYFGFDRSDLVKESKSQLDKLVEIMEANPELKLRLNAHTDSRGASAYNVQLSKRRGNSAYEYLVAHGISKDRLGVSAKGEAQLAVDCPDGSVCAENKHRLNRRVEFVASW